MSGFALTHRTVFDHPLFEGDAARLGAWLWLVGKACWKPTPFIVSGKTITLERGQLCVSRAQLSKAWGMSPSAVERFLTRLETEQMIGRETGQGRSVVTICNYAVYQDLDSEPGQATGQATGQRSDSDRTTKEQGNKGTIEEEPDGSSLPRGQCEQIVEAFNTVAKPLKLSTCQKLSPTRLKACKARIRDYGLDAILSAIQRIPDSAFLRGDRGDWAGANIDFLLRPDSVTRILEGRYDDRPANRAAAPSGDSGDGLSRAVNRWANIGDAAGSADEPDRSAVRTGEGHRQGAFALPGRAE